MIKKFFATLSTTCLLLAVTSVSPAPVVAAPALKAATTAEKNAFIKIYSKIDQLALSRNTTAMSNMMTNDFVIQTSSGALINKAQWTKLSRFLPKDALKINHVRSVVERLGTRKNEAVVVSSSVMDCIVVGPDRKQHRVVSSGQSMDTWVLTKPGWKVKLSQTISVRTTVDGRLVEGL